MGDSAYYIRDGKKYDRVSNVLSAYKDPGLIDWEYRVGRKEANRIKKLATNIGTRVHEMIEQTLTGNPIKFKKTDSIEVKNCLEAFIKFTRHHDVKLISMEKTVYSDELMVAGTYDMYCTVDGEPTLIDWKTSSKINEKYWVQLGAYVNLGKLGYDTRIAVCRLDKNIAEYEFEVRDNLPVYWETFCALHKVYRYFNGANGPQQEEVTNGNDE